MMKDAFLEFFPLLTRQLVFLSGQLVFGENSLSNYVFMATGIQFNYLFVSLFFNS